MKPANSIIKLEQYFINRDSFLHQILMSSISLDSNKELDSEFDSLRQAIIKEESRGILSKETLRKLKHYTSIKKFEKKISQVLDEIQINIHNKIDVLAEKELKIEYINNQIYRLNEIIKKVFILYNEYPPIDFSKFQSIEPLFKSIQKLFTKKGEIRIIEDYIENAVSIAGEFIKILPTDIDSASLLEKIPDNFEPIFLLGILNDIEKLKKRILANHYEICKDFIIEKKDGIVVRLVKSEQEVRSQAKLSVLKEYRGDIQKILGHYFSQSDQDLLKNILTTGNDVSKPLVFGQNGKELADVFKKLHEKKIIVNCNKKGLENWVYKNFQYISNGQIKSFTPRYLNSIISSKKNYSQKPILEILQQESGKFIIVPS